jgi:transposase-like protein
MKKREFNRRELRGLAIVAKGGMIRKLSEGNYLVRSSDLEHWYKVFWNNKDWHCECEDFKERQKPCKHIFAVLFLGRLPYIMMANYQAEGIKCPICRSSNIIRKGFDYNKGFTTQRYLCKGCGYKFSDKGNARGLKGNPTLLIVAADLFFKGLSYRAIEDHLKKVYAADISYPTLCRWTHRFIRLLKTLEREIVMERGIWHVDETEIKVAGNPYYVWNVIDEETRILLATILTYGRTAEEAEGVLNEALKNARAKPSKVVTDGLASYKLALKNKFGEDVEHVSRVRLSGLQNNNIVERVHQTIKERIEACRRLNNSESVKELLEGLRLYYNFLRPHSAFGRKSPYESLKAKKVLQT